MAPAGADVALSGRSRSALLDAAYAIELDEEAHLGALVDAWRPLPCGGPLSHAMAYRASPTNVTTTEHVVGLEPAMRERHARVTVASPRATQLALLRAEPGYGMTSEFMPRSRTLTLMRREGVPDFAGVLAPTHAGHVVALGAIVLEPPPAPRVFLAAFAHHLAAAWRLRKRLLAVDGFEGNLAARATPDGRVLETSPDAAGRGARERLRELVLARERARGAPGEPLWRALADGRYTIVDRFERSGARYVVAYRNPVSAPPLHALTPGERALLDSVAVGVPQKVLALERGVREDAISRAVRGALRRIGLASAMELSLLAASAEFVSLDDDVLGAEIVRAFRIDDIRADALSRLSPAERAVTADLLRGLSNREIAAKRNRSSRTIANQVASVLGKLGVDSRRALASRLRR